MEALGFKPKPESDKRVHHDAARADTNHPTRFPFGSESGGFRGSGFGCWGGGGSRGLFAAFLRDARGRFAAFMRNARGVCFLQAPAIKLEGVRSFVSSVRAQVCRLLSRSGRSEARRCNPIECLAP